MRKIENRNLQPSLAASERSENGLRKPKRGGKGLLSFGNFLSIAWVGYYLLLISTLSLGIYSRQLTVAYRVAVLVICILITFLCFKESKQWKWVGFLALFFVCYSLRLIENDINDKLTNRSVSEYLTFLWGITFMPAVGAFSLGSARRVDAACALRVLVPLALFSVMSLLFYRGLFSLSGDSMGVRGAGRSDQTISPLALGYMGAATVLIGLWGTVNFRGSHTRAAALFAGAVGLIPIILGASRGPLVGVILAATVYVMANLGRSVNRVGKTPKALIFAIILGSAGMFLVSTESAAVSRLLSMTDDYNDGKSSMTRTGLFSEAIDKFAASPFIGSHIELDNGMYPHNVLLEAFMSCGLAGILYLAVILRAAASAWGHLRDRDTGWVALIFFLLLVLNMVSGSIWGADVFTLTAMFFIGISGKRTTSA